MTNALLSAEDFSSLPFADDSPRIAISSEGYIIYASDSFYRLADIKPLNGQRVLARNVFEFMEPQNLRTMDSGIQNIVFAGHKIPISFHFDRLTMADNKSVLVASLVDRPLPQKEIKKKPAAKKPEPPKAAKSKPTPVQNNALKPEPQVKVEPERKTETKVEVEANKPAPKPKLRQDKVTFLQEKDDLRRFLNMSHDAMIITNTQGEIIRMNRTFIAMLGHTPQSLEGKRFIDLFANEDRLPIVELWRAGKHKTGIVDFEVATPTKNGKILMMEWRCKERDGQLYCLGRNVTKTKEHETALNTRKQQLSEAESIGRMGHWQWHVGKDKMEWSSQIFQIFGVDPDEFIPSLDMLNQAVHRTDVGRVIQAFQRALIEGNNYDMEFRIIQPSGDLRFIRCEGRCHKDAEGDVTALYGVMQDMTERMLYERELKEAKEGAERAYAAKTQFLANMSHELRTPLNAIIGFSDIINQEMLGPIGTEKYKDYISGIQESGNHLLDIISDILDMSKIEAGKYELSLEDVDIAKVLELVTHMMTAKAQEEKITLSTPDLKEDQCKIVADRRALTQMLLNVISNAVKFTSENGHISITLEENEKSITLRITDNGIGIPANKLQAITRPFEQASSSYSRDHEGSGLGLAITKELAKLHGGNLAIESTVGEGTEVSIRLPKEPKRKSA